MSLGAHVTFPWPWPTDSVDEILLRHALEHIGESTETFLRIMQELYRVCRHSAVINIFVPHPRHDDFLNDPTYVRPIMPTMFEHFSLKKNIEWDRLNGANTRLARITGTNFEMEKSKAYLDSLTRTEKKW